MTAEPESLGTPATSASSFPASVISSPHSSTTEPVVSLPPTKTASSAITEIYLSRMTRASKFILEKPTSLFDLKTPEKELSISVIEEPNLNLTPVNSCRRGDEAVNEEITTEIQESEIKHFKCIYCPGNDGYCHCGKCEDCESMMTKIGMNIHIINY